MKNNSNIYDIDGELVRQAGDSHRFTALEASNILKRYTEKIQKINEKGDLTDDEKTKLKIYEIYCKNLQHYIFVELQNMTPEQLSEYYKEVLPNNTLNTNEEDINNALNELKNDIETGENLENKVLESTSGDNEDIANKELGNDDSVGRESSNVYEERSITQDDLLVERDNVVNNMDEYVSPISETYDDSTQNLEK